MKMFLAKETACAKAWRLNVDTFWKLLHSCVLGLKKKKKALRRE